MVLNIHKDLLLERYGELALVSPSIEEACQTAAIDDYFSSTWTVLAAGTVLRCLIQSVYPPRNRILDKSVGILKKTFDPGGQKVKKRKCYSYEDQQYVSF